MSVEEDDFWKTVTKGTEKKTKPTETPTEIPTQQKTPPSTQENQIKQETLTETSEKTTVTPTTDDPFPTESQKVEETPKPTEELKVNVEVQEAVVVGSNTVAVQGQPQEVVQQTQETTTNSDPFGMEVAEETTTKTPSEEIATPPQSTEEELTPKPKEDPFGESKEVLVKKEFREMKPATSGKNISFMIFGKKGTTKTSTALCLPGRIFAISLDQQTAIIWEEFFDKDPRIEVWDGIEFFNSKNPETKLETAVKTVEYINYLLENPCKNFKPDWILIDGTERLSHVCEMAMRAQENLLPYEGVKNRNAWKYRNDLINNIVQRATQIAKLGVVFTAFTSIETVTTATGEEHREGPKWAGDIEQKTQIVIKTASHKIQGGRAFTAEVESSKVNFIPTGRKIIVGERMDSGEIQNNIGIKGLFTPEGVKKFWTGGEQ